jgi:hypothetical protein
MELFFSFCLRGVQVMFGVVFRLSGVRVRWMYFFMSGVRVKWGVVFVFLS